jgi:hypothetical protein
MASIQRKSPIIEVIFLVNLGSVRELVKDAGDGKSRSPQKPEKVR